MEKKEMILLYLAGAITAVAATSYFLYTQNRKKTIDISKFINSGSAAKNTPAAPKEKSVKPVANESEDINVIRNTIIGYIEKEMEHHLEEEGFAPEKAKEVTELVGSKINHILNNMNLSILVPEGKMETREQLEAHVMKIIESIRPKLIDELDRERRGKKK